MGNIDKFSLLEAYILKQIQVAERELQFTQKNKSDFSEDVYMILTHGYAAKRDILYQCLSAFDNTYNENKT